MKEAPLYIFGNTEGLFTSLLESRKYKLEKLIEKTYVEDTKKQREIPSEMISVNMFVPFSDNRGQHQITLRKVQ